MGGRGSGPEPRLESSQRFSRPPGFGEGLAARPQEAHPRSRPSVLAPNEKSWDALGCRVATVVCTSLVLGFVAVAEDISNNYLLAGGARTGRRAVDGGTDPAVVVARQTPDHAGLVAAEYGDVEPLTVQPAVARLLHHRTPERCQHRHN